MGHRFVDGRTIQRRMNEKDARVQAETRRRRVRDLTPAVVALVGADGSADIRTIVEQAVRDNPLVTADHIADIVRDARTEWAEEKNR